MSICSLCRVLSPSLAHIHTLLYSILICLKTSSKTHTPPVPLESTYRAWEENYTVILHNKSPAHVLHVHSLWANQMFHWLRSTQDKWVCLLWKKRPAVSLLHLPSVHKHQHGQPGGDSEESPRRLNSKDCHCTAGMSYYNLRLYNGTLGQSLRK